MRQQHDSPLLDPAAPPSDPTVSRIVLGTRLRKLRQEAGINRGEAGYVIRASEAKMSRLEAGRGRVRIRDVDDLFTLYRVTDSERRELLALAETANSPLWWEPHRDLVPTWFTGYLALERSATAIRTYQVQFVPGLLQTADYAAAVARIAHTDPEAIKRRVALRINRQQMIQRHDQPRLRVVIDEAALRRRIGGPSVMQAQLRHLIDIAERPNLTLQVLPLRSCGQAASGAFTLLHFEHPELPDLVYLEQLTSSLYLHRAQDVDYYARVFDRLATDSQTPTDTPALLTQILAET